MTIKINDEMEVINVGHTKEQRNMNNYRALEKRNRENKQRRQERRNKQIRRNMELQVMLNCLDEAKYYSTMPNMM